MAMIICIGKKKCNLNSFKNQKTQTFKRDILLVREGCVQTHDFSKTFSDFTQFCIFLLSVKRHLAKSCDS